MPGRHTSTENANESTYNQASSDDTNSSRTGLEPKGSKGGSELDRRILTPQLARPGLLFVVVAGFLLILAVGGVAAHDNVVVEPGASGHCESGDSGGSFATHVGDHYVNVLPPEKAERIASTMLFFAETEGECGGDDEMYVEAHATSTVINAQYCYDEQSDGDDGDSGHSDEPTDETTASNGLGEVTINDGTRNGPPGSKHEKNDNGQEACTYNEHGCEEEEDGNYTAYSCEGDSPESG